MCFGVTETKYNMARPKKADKYVNKTVKLPPELAERLEAHTKSQMTSLSMVIRLAILAYLDKHTPLKTKSAASKTSSKVK